MKLLDDINVTEISNNCIGLTFNNIKHLVDIFGKNDEILNIIEKKLSVEAIPKGNKIQIFGNSKSVIIAKYTLYELYNRQKIGMNISLNEVNASIRLAREKMGKNNKEISYKSIIKTQKKTILPRSINQNIYIESLYKKSLTFGIGPAGTGKTYLAVAAAASFLETGTVSKIILSRPAVEAGEKLGFLPGDMKEKVDPYLKPLYDALYDCLPDTKVERGLANGTIEIAPLAFMRGRTLENAFIILDEAQNCNRMQMKMFLTRLGENSKMAITGDPSQIDLPNKFESGLNHALNLTSDISEISQISFTSNDVVRHPLVSKIIKAYENE
ncbi:MAG: PhoH family protein [Alphaproteobacteria bacterium]|jgi:phosphate starvation-inducible PhoH-like protein|tara:strand:+ start:29573 stop:30553 length:981 start_codon:yes stop_codon:yes gene_type:complete